VPTIAKPNDYTISHLVRVVIQEGVPSVASRLVRTRHAAAVGRCLVADMELERPSLAGSARRCAAEVMTTRSASQP
jgi:hypothetical protein